MIFLIDITRKEKDKFNNDLIISKNYSDARNRIIDYIYDYALANCNLTIDKELINENLITTYFSLKDFLLRYQNINLDKELLIQAIRTDINHLIILKKFDINADKRPFIFLFSDSELKKAKGLMAYFINDNLISKYGEQDLLHKYEEEKLDLFNCDDSMFIENNLICELFDVRDLIFKLINENKLCYQSINTKLEIEMI